jgi:hypothetical protein
MNTARRERPRIGGGGGELNNGGFTDSAEVRILQLLSNLARCLHGSETRLEARVDELEARIEMVETEVLRAYARR